MATPVCIQQRPVTAAWTSDRLVESSVTPSLPTTPGRRGFPLSRWPLWGTQRASVFFHCPSSFLNILNMKPERVNTDVLFHCCKVRGHDWMKGTYSEKEKKKKEKQRHVSSFIRGKSNFQCICVVYVCVCVLSPKRAENCKLSLEHQCYKRDTFKKQPWHGCLFPDDSQWHIHFLTNTWTKYLPPLELQRLAALCFLCRAP